MKGKPHKILVVDDDRRMCRLLTEVLTEEGFTVTPVESGPDASKIIAREDFDVIISDLKMSGKNGLDLLRDAKKTAPTTPVILMTAYATVGTAVESMKMGAFDYIAKSGDTDELLLTVRNALETRDLRKEVIGLRKKLESRFSFHRLIGKSRAMREIYDLIELISDTSSNVLVTGESGTGKELVAKAIHYSGIRKDGPFIAVNCAAIPETLLESELFGYKKGAFTDARADKEGLVSKANEGTLFLDEITEMTPALQAKLLRVIEEKQVRPLGDTRSYPIDVRIISTSNRDVQARIEEGLFRPDLYYRIKVIDIEIPPLRERKEDIPMLAQHFVIKFGRELKKKVSQVSPETIKIFTDYPWPGNVRELENVIQRAVTLTRDDVIGPGDLPSSMTEEKGEGPIGLTLRGMYTLAQMEREYIARILDAVKGNRSRAAEILGIDRKTLYRKLRED